MGILLKGRLYDSGNSVTKQGFFGTGTVGILQKGGCVKVIAL